MPNWCSNELTIFGIKEDMEVFMKENNSTEEWESEDEYEDNVGFRLSFNRALPIPEDAQWFEWCNENWGTKWDIGDEDIEQEVEYDEPLTYDIGFRELTMKITFDTAWRPPDKWLEFVIVKYPRLNFSLVGAELGERLNCLLSSSIYTAPGTLFPTEVIKMTL